MSASFRQVAPLWACMTLTACITADAWASNGATLSSWLGTQVNMGSGDLSHLLQTGGEAFSDDDMASLDATLQASGIQTANRISVLIAETGAGLSLITLFDGQTGGGTGVPTVVTATSFIPDTATWQYNIEAGGSFDSFPLGNETVLSGGFSWGSGIESEAFAISNLQTDDVGSISFNEVVPGGLVANQTIQLLTSNGGVWSVADTFDFLPAPQGGPDFEYFSFRIGPIPGPAALAVLAIAGLAGSRRRRN